MIDYKRKPKITTNVLQIVFEAVILTALIVVMYCVLILISEGVI